MPLFVRSEKNNSRLPYFISGHWYNGIDSGGCDVEKRQTEYRHRGQRPPDDGENGVMIPMKHKILCCAHFEMSEMNALRWLEISLHVW